MSPEKLCLLFLFKLFILLLINLSALSLSGSSLKTVKLPNYSLISRECKSVIEIVPSSDPAIKCPPVSYATDC